MDMMIYSYGRLPFQILNVRLGVGTDHTCKVGLFTFPVSNQCQQQDLDDPNLNLHLPLVYASFNGSPNIFTEKNKQGKLLKIHRSIPTIISTG